MKYLGFYLLIVLGFSTNGIAQEKYFHELRGIEDSTGTTHLFYRMFEEKSGCRGNDFTNNIIRFNTSTEQEELFIRNGNSSSFYIDGCEFHSYHSIDFEILGIDPSKYVESGVGCSLDCGYGLSTYAGSHVQSGFTPVRVLEIDPHRNQIIIGSNFDFESFSGKTLVLPMEGIESEFYLENFFYGIADSVKTLEHSIIDISPIHNGVYFFSNMDNHLYRSTDFGLNSFVVDSSGIPWSNAEEYVYDVDSTSIYTKTSTQDDHFYFVRSDSNGTINSWMALLIETEDFFFDIGKNEPGTVYLSKQDSLLISSDFGKHFSFLFEFSDKIEGLYKKPSSNILYVLTNEELIELNVESLQQRVLKTLPVSNEVSSEIPSSIILHQNYPNPFNPSTVISYQLAEVSFVSLKVFDALGREVAVLDDGLKSAGNHVATFNANNYSSGVYYYVMDAEDLNQRLIKKMTLIK